MGVENIYCKNCGTKNEKTAKYCEKCGQTLNSGGSNTTKVLITLVLILFIGLGALAAYVMSMDTTPVVISSTYNETQEKTQAYQPSWKLIDTYQGVSSDSRSFTTRGNKFKVSYSANPLVNYNINYLEILLIQGSQVDHNLKFQLNNFKEKLKENYEAFFDEAVQVVNTPEFLSENKIALEEFKVIKAKTASINSLISTIDVILNFDISEELFKIKCPVLIFSGSEDKLTSIELSKIMQESLTDSRWIILKGEGHNLFVPSRITELEEYIQEFLENQG